MVSPFGIKSTNMHLSGFQGLPLFWRCLVMPFHVLSFHFWVQMVEPTLIISYNIEEEVIALGSMLSKQLR